MFKPVIIKNVLQSIRLLSDGKENKREVYEEYLADSDIRCTFVH